MRKGWAWDSLHTSQHLAFILRCPTVVHGVSVWVVRLKSVIVIAKEIITENALLSRSGPTAKRLFVPIPDPSAAYLFLLHPSLPPQGEIHSLPYLAYYLSYR